MNLYITALANIVITINDLPICIAMQQFIIKELT